MKFIILALSTMTVYFTIFICGPSTWGSSFADEIVKTIEVGDGPGRLEYNPDNGDMYVSNGRSDTISVIDSSTNEVVDTIPVGRGPYNMAYNSYNNNLYVANNGVSVIDSSTNEVVDTIPVGSTDIAFNPSNNYIYVTNPTDDTVSIISPATLELPSQTTIISASDGDDNSVQNESSTSSRTITFQVTATEGTYPIVGFECSLDGSQFSSCSTSNPSEIDYYNLETGEHVFKVRAVDAEGNVDPHDDAFIWTVLDLPGPPDEEPKTIGDLIKGIIQNPLDVTNSIESANEIKDILTDGNPDNDQRACNILDQLGSDQAASIKSILNC
jgi:YVTN family beta-propeller protein